MPEAPRAQPAVTPAPQPAAAPFAAWPGGWRRLWRVLVVHSLRDVLTYKSFSLHVALLVLLDRALHVWLPQSGLKLPHPSLWPLTAGQVQVLFDQSARWLDTVLGNGRTVPLLLAALALEEFMSLWQVSDMRLMHRQQRSRWGAAVAVASLRLLQIGWDAVAQSTVWAMTALLGMLAFTLCRLGMERWPSAAWLALLAAALGLLALTALMGSAYSSKLALLSRVGFGRKLHLYYLLYLDWAMFWPSWLFGLARLLLEAALVVIVPVWTLTAIGNFWLRLALASLVAAPAYSWIKLVSFKFFLEVYRRHPEVRDEYGAYYAEADR